MGWLSSTGGGLLRWGLMLLQVDWRFRYPSEVAGREPSVHVRLAGWLSLFYCLACNFSWAFTGDAAGESGCEVGGDGGGGESGEW